MKKEAFVTRFRLSLNLDAREESVYMTREEYFKLPRNNYNCLTEKAIKEYFTKERIEEFKKDLCEKIMKSENPFNIYEFDSDCYEVDEKLIWK